MSKTSFACIYLRQGQAVSGFFQGVGADEEIVSVNAAEKALEAQESGENQGIVIFNFAEEEQEQKESLDAIRGICQAVNLPVYCSGNLNRPEDALVVLEAGCQKAILNLSKEASKEMLAELSEKVGRDKLGVYVADYNEYLLSKEEIEEEASLVLIDKDGDDDSKVEEETTLPVLRHNDANGLCEGVNFQKLCSAADITWEELKLNSDGMIPCIVQDYKTNAVLMLAYMNKEAFEKTVRTGRMTYWSRSRSELWIKGLTSGHFQYVKSLKLDCDNDTLLARVAQIGAACHTGSYSCFFQDIIDRE